MRYKIYNFLCFLMFRSMAKDLAKEFEEKSEMNLWFASTFQKDILELERDDDARQLNMGDLAELRFKCRELTALAGGQKAVADSLVLARTFKVFRIEPYFWKAVKRTVDYYNE